MRGGRARRFQRLKVGVLSAGLKGRASTLLALRKMTAPYTLSVDGDGLERACYSPFIKTEFPAYEEFWAKHIVPLTNRPANIQFKDDAVLALGGHSHQNICIAQLHFSVLSNLSRAYAARKSPGRSDLLYAGISALVAAQDTAFDLLERSRNPHLYGPWLAIKQGGLLGSREARKAWQDSNSRPLEDIRRYRNSLMHGRTMPGIQIRGAVCFPMIGREN